MARPQTETSQSGFRNYRKPIKDRLNEKQLQDLDKELERFRVTRAHDNGKTISLIDIDAWLKKNGALSARGGVIVSDYTAARYGSNGSVLSPSDCMPIVYQQCEADIEQWARWKGRKEYGARERAKDIAKISEQLNTRFSHDTAD